MFELFLGVDIGSHLCCVGLLSFGCCCPVWVLGKCGGRGLVDWWVIQTGEDGVGGKVEGDSNKEGDPATTLRGGISKDEGVVGGATHVGRLQQD